MTTRLARDPLGRPASLHDLRVAEAMHMGVITCPPETSLTTVARIMAAHRIHAVVVRPREEDGAWGVVSDLDLAAAAAGGLADEMTAGAAAASPAVVVAPGESVERGTQLMREYAVSHLVVEDPGSLRPVGVLSTLDVADALAELPRPASPRSSARTMVASGDLAPPQVP